MTRDTGTASPAFRRVRLARVPDLRAAHRALAMLAAAGTAADARSRTVIVPLGQAASELRRTIEQLVLLHRWTPAATDLARLEIDPPSTTAVLTLPDLLTRSEWYARLHEETPDAPPLLTAFEREVLLGAAADAVSASGIAPPFDLRPGLLAEMLIFYDAVRRRQRTVDDFDRLLTSALEPSIEMDRGAARMLQQTRFLAAVFREYEARLAESGAYDEHGWRAAIATNPSPAHTCRHVILAIADEPAEPEGLWPCDFDLLMRLPGLVRIDVVATETMLATGWRERLELVLPGIEECRVGQPSAPPVLVAPERDEAGKLYTVSRDREDELASVLRRLHRDDPAHAGGPDTALIYQRPLPYLYLAQQAFESARVPYEAADALPLAGEPPVAAFDVVMAFVSAGYTRDALVALLASPHFKWDDSGWRPSAGTIRTLDARLRDLGYLGGRDRLSQLAGVLSAESAGAEAGDQAGPGHGASGRTGARRQPRATAAVARAAAAMAGAAAALAPLEVAAPTSAHLDTLLRFLDAHDRIPGPKDPLASRYLRARGALRAALVELRAAHQRFGGAPSSFSDVVSSIRRWIESHTFTSRSPAGGVRLIEARAARFANVERVHLLGLVEGDWPLPAPRNIFFPPFLLKDLGWPRETDRTAASRAAFSDLLHLAGREVSLSTFSLEDDALVRPSVLLEDAGDAALPVVRRAEPGWIPLFDDDVLLADDPPDPQRLDGDVAEWIRLRVSHPAADDPRFHGRAGPYQRTAHSVTSVEQYLECPFKYFAARVLELEEDRRESPTIDPRERGRFVHEVLHGFFSEWDASGEGALTPASLPRARALFTSVLDGMLDRLPPNERAAERARFLGTAASAGMAERVLRLELERAGQVTARRLEFSLEGTYTFTGESGPLEVQLRGIADRIDLLDDGTLRVIDYKTGLAPNVKRSIQLPVYARCAEERLDGHEGRHWRVADAGYVALGAPKAWVPAIGPGAPAGGTLAAAEARFTDAIVRIGRGEFPPTPADPSSCGSCGFAAVCRKEIVAESP